MSPRTCADCGDRPPRRTAGRLCDRCYHRRRRGTVLLADPEPTEAELDAMIAEQMRCLPAWWEEDMRKQAREDGDDLGRRVAGAARLLTARRPATFPPRRRAS